MMDHANTTTELHRNDNTIYHSYSHYNTIYHSYSHYNTIYHLSLIQSLQYHLSLIQSLQYHLSLIQSLQYHLSLIVIQSLQYHLLLIVITVSFITHTVITIPFITHTVITIPLITHTVITIPFITHTVITIPFITHTVRHTYVSINNRTQLKLLVSTTKTYFICEHDIRQSSSSTCNFSTSLKIKNNEDRRRKRTNPLKQMERSLLKNQHNSSETVVHFIQYLSAILYGDNTLCGSLLQLFQVTARLGHNCCLSPIQ